MAPWRSVSYWLCLLTLGTVSLGTFRSPIMMSNELSSSVLSVPPKLTSGSPAFDSAAVNRAPARPQSVMIWRLVKLHTQCSFTCIPSGISAPINELTAKTAQWAPLSDVAIRFAARRASVSATVSILTFQRTNGERPTISFDGSRPLGRRAFRRAASVASSAVIFDDSKASCFPIAVASAPIVVADSCALCADSAAVPANSSVATTCCCASASKISSNFCICPSVTERYPSNTHSPATPPTTKIQPTSPSTFTHGRASRCFRLQIFLMSWNNSGPSRATPRATATEDQINLQKYQLAASTKLVRIAWSASRKYAASASKSDHLESVGDETAAMVWFLKALIWIGAGALALLILAVWKGDEVR